MTVDTTQNSTARSLLAPRMTYTIDEVAKLLGISRNSAYRAAGRDFPTIRIGGRRLVRADRLSEMLDPAGELDPRKRRPGEESPGRKNQNHYSGREPMQELSTHTIEPTEADREKIEKPLYEFTAEQIEALESLRAQFTKADLAEHKIRQREFEKLLLRIAGATETLEEQEQLADELFPAFEEWIASRNRIQRARAARTLRVVATLPLPVRTERPRERRERRHVSRSTSSADPGDAEPAASSACPRARLTYGCIPAEVRS